jgi:hypothetical protein
MKVPRREFRAHRSNSSMQHARMNAEASWGLLFVHKMTLQVKWDYRLARAQSIVPLCPSADGRTMTDGQTLLPQLRPTHANSRYCASLHSLESHG